MDDDLTAWAERVAPTLGPEHWPHMRAALAADPPASKHTQAQCRALLARVEAIADGLTLGESAALERMRHSGYGLLRLGSFRQPDVESLLCKGVFELSVGNDNGGRCEMAPLGYEVARVLRERGGRA